MSCHKSSSSRSGPHAVVAALALLAAGCATAQQGDEHRHHAGGAERIAPAGIRPSERPWTQQPLLLPGRMARGERANALLHPQGIAAQTVTVFAPEGADSWPQASYPVQAGGAKIEPVTAKVGNYHWVVAREERTDEVRVASTAWYFGNPGASPTKMLEVPKHELEIVPAPLPRERGRYRESEKWHFLVRLNGQPLADQRMILETEFGTRSSVTTDANGIATVLFPRDFPPATEAAEGHGGPGRRHGNFVLATEAQVESRRYLTAFNFRYGEDGGRNRSLGWGAAFGLIGMLAATPLLRRRDRAQGNSKNA